MEFENVKYLIHELVPAEYAAEAGFNAEGKVDLHIASLERHLMTTPHDAARAVYFRRNLNRLLGVAGIGLIGLGASLGVGRSLHKITHPAPYLQGLPVISWLDDRTNMFRLLPDSWDDVVYYSSSIESLISGLMLSAKFWPNRRKYPVIINELRTMEPTV